jgi:DNA-directed RNA polymerase sigma subunit (sigma70/sigma32)
MPKRVSFHPGRESEAPELLVGYFSRIKQDELLTRDEEVGLSRRAKDGDRQAHQRLVEKNLRLAVSVAIEEPRDGPTVRGSHSRGQYRPD